MKPSGTPFKYFWAMTTSKRRVARENFIPFQRAWPLTIVQPCSGTFFTDARCQHSSTDARCVCQPVGERWLCRVADKSKDRRQSPFCRCTACLEQTSDRTRTAAMHFNLLRKLKTVLFQLCRAYENCVLHHWCSSSLAIHFVIYEMCCETTRTPMMQYTVFVAYALRDNCNYDVET